MRTLIKNATVLTMDDGNTLMQGVDIAIEDSYIVSIGQGLTFHDARVINAKGKLVMPGLINGHCHVPMTLLRNYADDMDLQTWLFKHIFPAEDRLAGEDVHIGSLIGIMEMLATGTTCFADMYDFMDDIAEAVEASGIRAQLSRGQICGDSGEDFSQEKRMREAIGFVKKWNGAANGRITAAMAPHAIYTCSPDYIKAIAREAEKLGVPIHTHVDETRVEHEDCLKLYGKTPVKHLYDLCLFDLKTIAAHCVWISPEDMALLLEKQVSIIHNPTSNLKLASGIAPIYEAQKKGINIAIGTDGASSNNNLNMFEELHLTGIIHKGFKQDPAIISANEVLRMATVNGAKALGLEKVGRIRKGYKADLIMIDLEKPHLKPIHKVTSALVYSAQGSDVCMTMVDGRILYQDGEFLTIDKERAFHALDNAFKRIFG